MDYFYAHGNDAAVTLAEHIAGNIGEFANLMNKKAQELELKNTHFVTPHGLDEEEHYTTAYELALITDYALNIKEFVNIVKTKAYTVYINDNAKNISNTNELLGTLDGVYGVKTGFTNGANRCLVTAVKRQNMDIICVVLGADTKKYRGKDSVDLIEYAFINYQMVDLKSMINNRFNEILNTVKFHVDKGINNELRIYLEDNDITLYPVYKNDIKDIKIESEIIEELEAPVMKNDVLGKINIKINEEVIYELEILAENDIHKKNVVNYYEELIYNMNDFILNEVSRGKGIFRSK